MRVPRSRGRILALAALAAALLFLAGPAQAKELHWSRFDVTARLDADGRLHVVERQAIVFTGDWNGGYRTFRIATGTRLGFEGISRIDPATGASHPLAAGDLSAVDQFKWMDNSTIRWRSRLPSDPEFDNTEIVYELRYAWSNVLVKSGDAYRLSHDFAFPDRESDIRKFTLDLAIDPAWAAPEGFQGHIERKDLRPGEGVLVQAALRRVAPGTPSSVRTAVPAGLRRGLAAAAGIAAILLYVLYRRREASLGRYQSLYPVAQIDEAWLKENVFDLLPEEAGAVWDDRIGGAEVGALIARMVAEKKLATRVEASGWGPFRSQVLHLELKTSRERLEGYEKSLIAGLFFDSRTETDTKAIREYYSGTGFDPASKIRAGVEAALAGAGLGKKAPAVSHRPTLLLLGAALALFVLSVILKPFALGYVFMLLFVSVFCMVPAGVLAFLARRNIFGTNVRLLVAALLALGPAALLWLRFDVPGLPAAFFAGTALLAVAYVNVVFNLAKSREGEARLKKRRTLAAGREYFRRELATRTPRLKDEWFPYAIGFGLGASVDRWFGRFGAAGAGASAWSSGGATSLSSGGSSSGGGWTGGGGAFGGAGATAGWVSAVGVMSAGVSAPSSSGGSGGGGGGGGSSGGGGGGGW